MTIEDILAPYQYDPLHSPELVESFEAQLNWFGTKRKAVIGRFIVRPDSSNFYTFWRFENDDGAWCLLEAMGSLQLEKIWDQDEAAPEKLLQRIRSSIGKGAFCRLFFLPEIEKYVGVTSCAGTFYHWIDRPAPSFHFHENKLKRQLCSETKQIFDNVLADEKSDAAFALRILKHKDPGAQALVFDFAGVEEYQESAKIVERLITVVIWSAENLWNPEEDYIVHVPMQKRPFFVRDSSHGPMASQITEREQYEVELIKRFGPLQIGEERRKKHRALENWTTMILFQIAPPTAHERIAAKFEFLEWAKATLPPEIYEEVEAMERQL